MLKRITIAAVMSVLLGLLAGPFVAPAGAAPPTDFWQNKNFMNIAHQGGEVEAPSNTLYAFKTAAARGADAIELDGYLTEDGEFVVTHDMEPHKTSNAPYSVFGNANPPAHVNPDGFIMNQTLAELKEYDFAYKFRPGRGQYGYPHQSPEDEGPAADYVYRGIATGEKEPPAGFTANDFKIATLREVLDAMPHTPMSVDIKAPRGDTSLATIAAAEVAEIMNEYPQRSDDVIIVSFFQEGLERFHELAPNHRALGATEGTLLPYAMADEPITPTPVALQPPDNYVLSGFPGPVDTVPVLKSKAVRDGYAIQVWPQNGSVDGPALWRKVIDQGANGFFTERPSELHRFLCENGIPRPDGSLRCPEQQCPAGFTGYAPHCQPVASTDPRTVLTKVNLAPKKGKVRAGRTVKLKVKIRAKAGTGPSRFRIKLKSSNKKVRLPKSVVVRLAPQGTTGIATGTRTIKVKIAKKAKGKARITAKHGKLSARSVLRIKKAK